MRTGHSTLSRFCRWLGGAVVLLAAAAAIAQPVASYRNDGSVFNPQIDATDVVNAGRIETFTGSAMFQPLDMVNFANLFGASIIGNPGLRFDFLSSATGLRSPSANFVNRGSIFVSGDPLASIGLQTNSTGTLFAKSGGRLLVTAANIDANSGTIVAGAEGLVRLVGTSIDAGFTRMQVGGTENLFFPGVTGRTNFINPTFIRDLYWAAGTNQAMNTNFGNPQPLFLGSGQPFGTVPFISAPIHQVDPRSVSFALLPEGSNALFQPFVYIDQVTFTSRVVQVVYLATNSLDTNLFATVRFAPRGAGTIPIVEFASRSFSFVDSQYVTNAVYFSDGSLFVTNTLVQNFADQSFRPFTYDVSRTAPVGFFAGLPANAPYSSVVFYQPGFTNVQATNSYSAYRGEIGINPFATNYSSFNPGLSDPTNYGGRVELIADRLNLAGAAIHAETSITIKTTNLAGIQTAILDAPIINYDLVDSSPTLALTNIVPPSVARINGRFSAWSGSWTNADYGNTNALMNLTYHVLILDASQLLSAQAVASPTLSIRSTNVQLETTLNASRTFTIDASSVTFNSSNRLSLSSNFFPVLGITNFPSLTKITNAGFIFVPGEARFGSDRPLPLASVVNRGSNAFISASAQFIRADSFENGGTLEARSGPINVQATSSKLENGSLTAASDIVVGGGNLKIRNHVLRTSGRLIFNLTNSLTDLGIDASNTLHCAFGFRMDAKPASGSLLGTTITTVIPPFSRVPHVWGATDLGPSRAGFSNNLALGRLVINGDNSSRADFSALTPGSALYVDYLEATGAAATVTAFTNILTINPGLTIYFAGSSLPVDKLDGLFDGRLRWVREYAGANSSADVILPTGLSVRVNAALLESALVDSDADGVPNKFDLSPFDGVTLQPRITFTNVPVRSALISWESAAQTVYRVEYATSVASPPPWPLLRFYTNSTAFNSLVTIQDPVPTNGAPRFYRVLYSP